MSLSTGARLGPYEICGAIGAGGMGEVYRATDTRLGREVAIKVLPAAVAGDAERLARFEREARLLASLNHANIAHVYGFESATLADGAAAHFLAMELVEGEDLAQRLKRGAIPVDEVLVIAKQIAEALEEAHEKGIVHRDLKPANVKLTPDGKVKVLDFGLAKAYAGEETSGSSADLSRSPTLAHTGTQAGVILGTAAYMSPEQARGKPVDKRADIWAFGVVLYEMLTGRQLFTGETVSDILAGVLKNDVDLARLPDATPAGLRQLLRRCLERDPRHRLHDVADARIAIEEVLEVRDQVPAAAPALPPPGLRVWLPRGVAALALVALGAWIAARGAHPPLSPLFVDVAAPEGEHFVFQGDSGAPIALASDGAQVVFGAAGSDSKTRLWVRSLATGATRRIDGTEGASSPFFSPDGKSVGYFANAKLMVVPVEGGAPRSIADAPNGRGGAWTPDGSIVFAPDFRTSLLRVPVVGGTPQPLTQLDTQRHSTHRWPTLTPDGRALVYLATTHDSAKLANSELRWVKLDGSDDHALLQSPANGVVAGRDLLYLREKSLLAHPIDASGRLTGKPRAVGVDPLQDVSTWRSTFTAAAERLIYAPGGQAQGSHLSRVDRSGRPTEEIAGDDAWFEFRLSPDGRRLAVSRGQPTDIWVLDLERKTQSRLTFDPLDEGAAVWSRDGRWIYYATYAAGSSPIARKAANGTGGVEIVYTSPTDKIPQDLSADGQWMLIQTGVFPFNQKGDLEWLALDGSKRVIPFLATPAAETLARLSPDGRWLAYVSNESGAVQVYVVSASREVPAAATTKWQVSIDGGSMPIWSRDGRELVFLDAGLNLMRVDVAPDGAGGLRFGAPQPMFGTTLVATQVCYDLAPDGQSLILNHYGTAQSRPLRLIDNWRALATR